MISALVIRHVSFEDIGSFAPILSKRNIDLRYLDAGIDNLTNIDPCAPELLVILGGPISVYEKESYPFLSDEISILKMRFKEDLPTLGICLGAQLMAEALGSRVYPGSQKEIGWGALTLTDAGKTSPLSSLSRNKTSMLHWHGDTFDLPNGATLLASTDLCHHQAFSWRERSLALQCHPEVTMANMERWFIGHACEIAMAKLSVRFLREQTTCYGAALETQGGKFFSDWLTHVGL